MSATPQDSWVKVSTWQREGKNVVPNLISSRMPTRITAAFALSPQPRPVEIVSLVGERCEGRGGQFAGLTVYETCG